MSPVVALAVSVLEREAALIEKGLAPAKAKRQVAAELVEYGETHPMEIPSRSFAHLLGAGERRAA